jgi:hypothetical protein
MAKTGFKIKSALRDVVFLIGSATAAWGVFQIYPPAAWIVSGVLVAWLAIPGRKGAK